MVDYLPCSNNTWESFGINQTTVLEEYLDALPNQSPTTSSHYNNIYELNVLGEYEEVVNPKNCYNLALSANIESTPSDSSLSCSEYLGDYLMLANHVVESHSEEATLLFQCSVCGNGLRRLISKETTCSANDRKITNLCLKCAQTMISPAIMDISLSMTSASVELNPDMTCEKHCADSIHEQHLSMHRISKPFHNLRQNVSVQPGKNNVVGCQDCGGKSSYIICRESCSVDDWNMIKTNNFNLTSRNISNNSDNNSDYNNNTYGNMSDMNTENCMGNSINGVMNSPGKVNSDIREKDIGSQVQFDRCVGNAHITEKPFRCNICGKHFKWNGNLKVHMRIHSGERPFHCPDCGKRFRASNDLRRHKRRHTGEMPYKCSTCSMSFKSNSEMKQHGKIHQSDRPHQCDECGKRFISKSNLKTHLRVHSGERPYKCVECSRTFGTSTNLKNHQRVHSGIKPYQCPVCGKQFSQSNNLTIHKKKHERHEDV